MKHLPLSLLVAFVAFNAFGALACQKTPDATSTSPAASTATAASTAAAQGAAQDAPGSLYAFSATRLDGTLEPLATYKGKVALVVNTASECGYTPQYAGLQKLYEELSPKGLVVLGFPSNDFGGQEPGSSKEIAAFCSTKFKVTFPLFDKVVTKGSSPSPIYAFLAKGFGRPEWNFHKYVVGRDGLVKRSFPSKVTPESDELRKALDDALAAPAP